jgi:hypothetical protein
MANLVSWQSIARTRTTSHRTTRVVHWASVRIFQLSRKSSPKYEPNGEPLAAGIAVDRTLLELSYRAKRA